jgi:hypothetical protein
MATVHMGPAEVDTVQSGTQWRAAGSDGDFAELLVYKPRPAVTHAPAASRLPPRVHHPSQWDAFKIKITR